MLSNENRTFCSLWNSVFWTLHLYVYYLIHGFIASTSAFYLPTHAFNLATRAFNLLTYGFELVTHGFELVTCESELITCGFELVTCGFELVTCVLLFHRATLNSISHKNWYSQNPSFLLKQNLELIQIIEDCYN